MKAIIGDRPLHPAQREILDRLRAGKSTFAVMATGRGKSLCFQTYAAFRALTDHAASLFIYPLRALIADQVFHLRASLERFGIASAVITGESTPEERAAVYAGLADGSLDIVLTTPEYLMFHTDELAASGRVGFVVVDEAHHIGQAKARPARGLHPARPGADPARRPRGARGDRHGQRRRGRRHRCGAADSGLGHRRDGSRQPVPG